VNANAPTSYRELADLLDNLPLLIREARRTRGLSLRAAAREIGTSFNTLTRVEHGAQVTSGNAADLLRWLDGNAKAARP
jgi:transcriptional regulator with XRE-family HTH domain